MTAPALTLPRVESATPPADRRPARIVPSVLPVDFARLGAEVRRLEEAGVDRIQWDVMDGVFVPNLTFGPDVIAAARQACTVGFEAHLMVVDPDPMLPRYAAAGCELIIVHAEATRHLHRTLAAIRDLGVQAGVALNPATGLDGVCHVLDLVDLLLVMTVNPGFGGQAYLPSMELKIAAARGLLDAAGSPADLEVDGGIGPATIAGAAAAGADVFCAGSALFAHPAGLAAATAELRRVADRAAGAPHRPAAGGGTP